MIAVELQSLIGKLAPGGRRRVCRRCCSAAWAGGQPVSRVGVGRDDQGGFTFTLN